MLNGWANFYVITGAAGSTLIGVQFVVMTLVATMRNRGTTEEAIGAFGTPTVVHFTAAVLISTIMSAPWSSLVPLSAVIAISGLGAFGYSIVVIRRAHRQTTYKPEQEDWLWHAVLPCCTYAAMTVAALVLHVLIKLAMFTIGASTIVLLLIGIHNSWDTVTYMVVENSRSNDD